MNISSKPVLKILNAVIGPESDPDACIKISSLEIRGGDMVSIEIPFTFSAHFSELALGLTLPQNGEIEILGKNWKYLKPSAQTAMRGLIRRIYRDNAFINNLDLYENISLCSLHHVLQSETDLLKEINNFADSFGISDSLSIRPCNAGPEVLLKAQWVRALTGNPLIIFVENNFNGYPEEFKMLLFREIDEIRKKGTAVLFSGGGDDINGSLNRYTKRYILDGESNLCCV